MIKMNMKIDIDAYNDLTPIFVLNNDNIMTKYLQNKTSSFTNKRVQISIDY